MSFIISCEHAGNHVPDEYADLFSGDESVLDTHRGWDPGAWEMAQYLSALLKLPVYGCHVTRLLIEANRSRNSHQLFSAYSIELMDEIKEKLLREVYYPYRNAVEEAIRKSAKPVVHLSIHSFTPSLNGETREMDIGLLYDPGRKGETDFCERFRSSLAGHLPQFRIVFNEPYKGTDDGFTSFLRTRYPDEFYRGIEIELSQKLIETPGWMLVKEGIAKSLADYTLES